MTDLAHSDLHQSAAEIGIKVWAPTADDARWRRVGRAAREALRGVWPARYVTDSFTIPFYPRLADALRADMRVLDVGAGARPTVPVHERPSGCTYVGFDVDAEELEKSPPGSYDEIVVGDVCELQPPLVGEFDLIVSWLAMEHVESVPDALRNLRRYQRPGGRFLGYVSGGRSVHAVLNRVVPEPIAKFAMERLLGREPDTVFRAHYDQCYYDALWSIVDGSWAHPEVVPVFTGGWYLEFSRLAQAPFFAYEEWAYTGGHSNLAAYYLIDAVA